MRASVGRSWGESNRARDGGIADTHQYPVMAVKSPPMDDVEWRVWSVLLPAERAGL